MIFPTRHHHWHGELSSREPDLPWMLLFHGFLGCTRSLNPLAKRITSRCNPFLLDLPGHGETRTMRGNPLPNGAEAEPETGFQTEAQMEDLVSIIDRLQCGPVWLYGYSMGGRLALQLATARPDLVSGLILESSTPGIADEADRRERQTLDRQRAESILEDLPGFLETWERMPLFRSGPDPGSSDNTSDIDLYSQHGVTHGRTSSGLCSENATIEPFSPRPCTLSAEGLAASLLGFGAGRMPSVWEALGSLEVPVLLVSGGGDLKFKEIHRQMARRLPNATNLVVKGAGHRVHRDRPDAVANAIIEFLSM